jgi:hypothetical protein
MIDIHNVVLGTYSVVSISYDGYRHILASLKMDMPGIEVALLDISHARILHWIG